MSNVLPFPGPEPTPEEKAYFGLKYRVAVRLQGYGDESLLTTLWLRAGCPKEPSLEAALRTLRLSRNDLREGSP